MAEGVNKVLCRYRALFWHL